MECTSNSSTRCRTFAVLAHTSPSSRSVLVPVTTFHGHEIVSTWTASLRWWGQNFLLTLNLYVMLQGTIIRGFYFIFSNKFFLFSFSLFFPPPLDSVILNNVTLCSKCTFGAMNSSTNFFLLPFIDAPWTSSSLWLSSILLIHAIEVLLCRFWCVCAF